MTIIDVEPRVPPTAATQSSGMGHSTFGATSAPYVAVPRRIRINPEGAPPWAGNLEARVNAILDLDVNWDTYGAPQVSPENVVNGLRLLAAIVSRAATYPMPAVVPTVARGVQFEWEVGEVCVGARVDDFGPRVYVEDATGEVEGLPTAELLSKAARTIAALAADE